LIFLQPASLTFVIHAFVVAAVAIHVIMRRPATGVALAWLLLVAILPFVGPFIYFLIGNRRISGRRIRGFRRLRRTYERTADMAAATVAMGFDWHPYPAAAPGLYRLGCVTTGSEMTTGNGFRLFSHTQEVLAALARDIDAAKTSVLIEFYIWNEGGGADEVLEALIRAAGRGVRCLVLIDAVGARPWWKSAQPQRLREAGVHLRQALPVSLLRSVFGRTDLRLHRKIAVIDQTIAWTGSMNLVDPRFFKQDAGVGEWVDAMVRLEGGVVTSLAAVMIGDWSLETNQDLAAAAPGSQPLLGPSATAEDLGDGHAAAALTGTFARADRAGMQVMATGPGETEDALLLMLLALIGAATTEIVLTTPYFVPEESVLRALRTAAGRGTRVVLVVPEKVDSFLSRYASRSYYDELLEMGVEICLYRGGLLHTKSITVDGSLSMFGTVNLDMRSLWLNYEVALFVYDRDFASDLRALQESYIKDSIRLDRNAWSGRPFHERFMENALRLAGPLI
jgi:cardiolipin synthase